MTRHDSMMASMSVSIEYVCMVCIVWIVMQCNVMQYHAFVLYNHIIVCVCLYVCMYSRTYVAMHACMYIHIHIHIIY